MIAPAESTDQATVADQADQAAPLVTVLSLPPINHAAPGSRRLELERQRLSGAYLEAVGEYNEAIDDMNEARDAVIAEPDSEAAAAQLTKELVNVKKCRRAVEQTREAYHQHLIGRMVTNDGTSVAEVLDAISMNDFDALVKNDVESVAVPKAGAVS